MTLNDANDDRFMPHFSAGMCQAEGWKKMVKVKTNRRVWSRASPNLFVHMENV